MFRAWVEIESRLGRLARVCSIVMRSLFVVFVVWLACTGVAEGESSVADVTVVDSLPSRLSSGWEPVTDEAETGVEGGRRYRLRIVLDDRLRDVPLGVALGRVGAADVMRLNGVQIGATGSFGPELQRATLYPRVYPVPASAVRFGAVNVLELVLPLDDWGVPPGRRGPELGRLDRLLGEYYADSYIIIAFAVFFLVVALNHLFLAVHYRESADNALLAGCAAASSLFVLTFSPTILPSVVSLNVVLALHATSVGMAVVLFVGFLFAFFGERLPPAAWIGSAGIAAAALLVTLSSARAAGFVVAVVAGGLLLVIVGAFLVGKLRERATYAPAITAVVALIAAAVSIDVLTEASGRMPVGVAVAGLVFPIAAIPFYLVLGMTVGHRYWRYYRFFTTDPLTGLLQRRRFEERMAPEIDRAGRTRAAILLAVIDLDGFKRINDELGHAAGDRVLAAAARLVREGVRPFDLVGRYGGDELTLGMVVDDEIDGLRTVSRICRRLQGASLEAGRSPVDVRASFGVAVARPSELGSVSVETLLRHADAAMYVAKEGGGGRVSACRMTRGDGGPAERIPPGTWSC